jgi:hypothetical protein
VGPTRQWFLQPPAISLLPRSLQAELSQDRRPRLGARSAPPSSPALPVASCPLLAPHHPFSCSPTPADPGPGQRAVGRTLLRREAVSNHAEGRAPPRWEAAGARRSTIDSGPPCPSDRVEKGGGRHGSPRHRHRQPALPAPPRSVRHAPAASVPAPLGPAGSCTG